MWVLEDSGYQGLHHLNGNVFIPHKKPKGGCVFFDKEALFISGIGFESVI